MFGLVQWVYGTSPPSWAFGSVVNRVSILVIYTNGFTFHGVACPALDAKESTSLILRLITGKMNPSLEMVARVTAANEATLGYRIDPRDLVAELAGFLTPCV